MNWSRSAGTPAESGVVVDSASPVCGSLREIRPVTVRDRELYFQERSLAGLCTVTLRTVNAAGASPPASVTFW